MCTRSRGALIARGLSMQLSFHCAHRSCLTWLPWDLGLSEDGIMGEDGPGPSPRCPTNLAEVQADSVIILAGQLVAQKPVHLVLGPDDLRLDGAARPRRRKREQREGSGTQPPPRLVVLTAWPALPTSRLTHWTLSWGVGFFTPAAAHLRWVQQECSQMEHPIAGERVHHLWADMPERSMPTRAPADAPKALTGRGTNRPTVCLALSHPNPVWPSKDVGPVEHLRVCGNARPSVVKLHTARSAELG